MENVIAAMLEEEIKKTLKEVSEAKTGTDGAKQALMKLEKLHAQRVKELESEIKNRQMTDSAYQKMEETELRKQELEIRATAAEAELEVKKAELDARNEELKEAKRGRRWRTVLDFLGIGVPVLTTAYWMKRGLQFEEEGKIYTSRTGQWLSTHLRLFGKKG